MGSLIDPDSQKARPDAIEMRDANTVVLKLSKPDISIIPAMTDCPALIVHRGFDPATATLS